MRKPQLWLVSVSRDGDILDPPEFHGPYEDEQTRHEAAKTLYRDAGFIDEDQEDSSIDVGDDWYDMTVFPLDVDLSLTYGLLRGEAYSLPQGTNSQDGTSETDSKSPQEDASDSA